MVVLLTKKQVAERLHLHPEHVMALAREGKFPAPIRYGEARSASVRFVESEIDAWITEKIAVRDAQPQPAD